MFKKITTQKIIINGLARLIDGQLCFAEEFGLKVNRIFPYIEIVAYRNKLEKLVQNWFEDEKQETNENLKNLFEVLIKHQLALLAALDGIVLQTIKELTEKSQAKISFGTFISRSLLEQVQELKNNSHLRYQRLIVPGFIDEYIRIYETGDKNNYEKFK